MGAGNDFEIPETPRDVNLRPMATARQDTRQQTSIVGWTSAFGDVAVTASFYQRWSRARLFAAEGPLTAQAQLERTPRHARWRRATSCDSSDAMP